MNNVVHLRPRGHGNSGGNRPPHNFSRPWTLKLIFLTCALIPSAALIFVLYNQFSPLDLYQNDTNRPLTIALGSHSTAVINLKSALTTWRLGRTQYASLSAGEVIFDIRNKLGLTTYAGDVDIQELGTRFSIKLAEQRVEIILENGILMVSGRLFRPTPLMSGHQIIVSGDGDSRKPEINSISPEQIRSAWAWRDHPDGACQITLGELARQINTKGGDQIILPDSLASQTYTALGGVHFEKPQELAELLKSYIPGVEIDVVVDSGHKVFTARSSLNLAKHEAQSAAPC